MSEDRWMSISSGASLDPADVASRRFPLVRKGFDPDAVTRFLEQVARELDQLADREQRARQHATDLERRLEGRPEINEDSITSVLGQETARVLSSARDAAREIVQRAEEEAAAVAARAEQDSAERAEEADRASAEMLRAAQSRASEQVAQAEADAGLLLDEARDACRSMVQESQEARNRILGDLVRRRRVLHAQVEQLGAGRDSIAKFLAGVRESLDAMEEGLQYSDADARRAAEQAAMRTSLEADPQVAELLDTAATLPAIAPVDAPADLARAGATVPRSTFGPAGTAPAAAAARARLTRTDPGARGTPADAADADIRILGAPAPVAGEPATEDAGPGGGPVGPGGGPVGPGGGPVKGSQDPASGPAPAPPVDDGAVQELFAKLRRERESTAKPSERATATARAQSARAVAATGADNETEADGSDGSEPSARSPEMGPTAASPPAGLGDDGTRGATSISEHVASRDAILTPIVAGLARALKRTMSDEQNEALDRMRRDPHVTDIESLLPRTGQLRVYTDAAAPFLAEAYSAGRAFWTGSPPAPSQDAELKASGAMADELGEAIAAALRLRLDLDGLPGDDAAVITDRVGAAYREWKGAKIEGLADDHVLSAFSAGVASSVQEGVKLGWHVATRTTACPDCDDNALEVDHLAGTPFPTGQHHPPAHAGCRCLLKPEGT